MPNQQISTITKQKIATRTVVTVTLLAMGILASAASGIYFTQNYQPPYYADNQADNQTVQDSNKLAPYFLILGILGLAMLVGAVVLILERRFSGR